MKADFESAIEEIKTVFAEFREILVVILYGSVSRGDFSRRHSDMDLLIVINKKKADAKLKAKIQERVSSVSLKHSVRPHIEYQSLIIDDEDKTLLEKVIEEGKVIYSSGIWYFNSRQIGLKQFILYSFSTKDSCKKTLFSKALHGRKSWYYKGKKKIIKEYPGIIDKEDILQIGKGGLLVRKEKQQDIEEMFQRFGVSYRIIKIVYG